MLFRIPTDQLIFPDPTLAEPSGLLGIGGDLSPQRVLLAYRSGIFPWYNAEQPILWWSPDPRMLLKTADFRVPRSLAKRIRQQPYTITADQAFARVLAACAQVPRPGQSGTWITDQMTKTYDKIHQQGHAHSIEAWDAEGQLVGGLYGVLTGRVFSGESMFAKASDASKICFAYLISQLKIWDVDWVDCQVHTQHLARFGAQEIPRLEYLEGLQQRVGLGVAPEKWVLDSDLEPCPRRS